VQLARDQVAGVVDCKREEVLFTSGATESNNLAILGLADFGAANNRRHIVSTMIEHKAVLEPLADLETRGFEVTYVKPQPDGVVRAADVLSALRPDTLLVSVMHVNNETGVLQPIDEIAAGMAKHLAYLHVDAAQSFGKIPKMLSNQRIDLISVSGHKIYSPKGIGALIARRRGYEKAPIRPLMFGGGQERGIRPGTLPVALIAALGESAALSVAESAKWMERCRKSASSRPH
jgi:cysteine desulfurase